MNISIEACEACERKKNKILSYESLPLNTQPFREYVSTYIMNKYVHIRKLLKQLNMLIKLKRV